MPTLKIMHSVPLSGDPGVLAADLEAIVIRNRSGRTAGRMKAQAAELHKHLAAELDFPPARIRVRVLLDDEDHAFGVS
jgi:hypothetical protein